MPNPAIAFAKEHPVPVIAGAAVLGIGVILLMNRGGGSSAQASGSDPAAAYFAAAAAQGQAGDQVQIAQIAAQAGTTQTLLNDQTSIANATTWATAQTTQASDTNATTLALAPYGVESQAISGLTTAAQAPPITTTSTSRGFNLFGLLGGAGIGGGTKTTTTPNPLAVSAVNELDQYLNGFSAGH